MRRPEIYKSTADKGMALSQWLAAELRRSGADKSAKALKSSGNKWNMRSDLYTKLRYSFECKNQKTTKPNEWYDQAAAQSGMVQVPVVVYQNDIEPPKVILSAKDFINMIAEIEQHYE